MSSALHVDVGGLLLGVGGTGQDDVGELGAGVTVVTLKFVMTDVEIKPNLRDEPYQEIRYPPEAFDN